MQHSVSLLSYPRLPLSVALMALCVLGLFSRPLYAHPHVFVECAATFVFDDRGLAGLRQTWRFDEMYSSMILMDLGIFGADELDRQTQDRVRAYVFDQTKSLNYFTHLFADGRKMPTPDPGSFAVRLDQGQLVFEFETPFLFAFTRDEHLLTLAVYDETFFVFMDFPPLEIEMVDVAEAYHIDWEDRCQTEIRYYFDQVTPVVVDVAVRRK